MTKITISAGHGSKIRGASDIIDEVDEARRVVLKVVENLKAGQIPVEYFFDDVSTSQNENLQRICDWHNSRSRTLDVSIHFNASQHTSKPVGTECWYVSQDQLASEVAEAIAGASGLIDRGKKYSSGLYFLNHTAEPAVLVEVCFVDSVADCDLYEQYFDEICEALAMALAGEPLGEAPPEQPPASSEIFQARGKCSWFGGPADMGVSSSEDLAWLETWDQVVDKGLQHLFLKDQPSGTTGLARRLNAEQTYYLACRWDYDREPKAELADPQTFALVRGNGRELYATPIDWGPHGDTDRIADLSPALMKALDITTDDVVEVIYPAPPPGSSLG
jgi:N-acetylmuramoyl-L-alanine amidase